MWVLRIAVLTIDTLSLLFVLIIRFAPTTSGHDDGEGWYWAGLLLVYALFLVLGLALLLNVVFLVALAFMRRRYDNNYNRVSRACLLLLPAATALVIVLNG
ncbi:hypothetical protein [Arthrobacter sp. SAFR-044]|uniref:hypothetical protein n=1 Tax=Arthrobacter sp. SAFR-044 TaxID=3387278 RepID=UPI003F7C8ACF